MNIYGLGMGLGMPSGKPLSLGFQFSNFLAKLYINIYHIQKISEQSHERLVQASVMRLEVSPGKIWVVLGTPMSQP